MIWKAFLTLALTLLSASPALANDAAFGGRGADPMPLKNDAIEMVEEHIVLRADDAKNVWNVSCDFTFKNTTDKEVTLQIGFPFPENDGEGDTISPKGVKAAEAGDVMVWKFESWVRGKKVKVTKKKVGENPTLPDIYYQYVFLWDVTFKPNETVKIRNTYIHGMNEGAIGISWIDYVLKTGALWKGGKIGRSRLEVHGPPGLLLPTEGYGDEGYVRELSTRKPAGSTVKKRKDGGISVYWDLKNFTPKEDLIINFIRPDGVRYNELVKKSWTDAELAKMSKKELRLARNQISAIYGYQFKSKDLQKHFESQWWYQPDPKFSFETSLEPEDKEMVAKIKALETKK